MSHVSYVVWVTLLVRLNDRSQKTLEQSASYTIPQGHDACVEGNERFVCIEVTSAERYAKIA